nr:hypothetical protein [Propionibacterium sp.]
MTSLVVDCDRCRARGPACGDCVISALLGEPAECRTLDAEERRVLGLLADSGLLPPLRLVTPLAAAPPDEGDGAARWA